MKYKVVEYYSYTLRSLQFRVEYKHSWLHPWEVIRSYDTKEQAISHIKKVKAIKEKVVYVSN